MAALRNRKPSQAFSESDRSSWKEKDGNMLPQAGWTPFPHDFFHDLPRLLRGSVQWAFITYGVRLTLGLEPERREDGWPDWTPWCPWDQLAERCKTTVRTLQEEVHELAKRAGGAVIKVQERRGEVRFCLLWSTWSKLADYSDVPRPVLEIVPKDKEPARLLEKPFTVRAGRKSRPIAIPGWEKEIAFQGGATDCAVSLFLESDSRLLVETAAAETGSKKNQQHTDENRHHSADYVASSSPVNKTAPVKKEPALSVPKPLAHACAQFGLTDDSAILQLVVDCQSYAPECSIEEITAQVFRVGKSASPKLRNKAWLIKTEVPKYFNSTAYREGIEVGMGREHRDIDEKGRRIIDRLNRMRGIK
jgi:hypothetical protein